MFVSTFVTFPSSVNFLTIRSRMPFTKTRLFGVPYYFEISRYSFMVTFTGMLGKLSISAMPITTSTTSERKSRSASQPFAES